MSEQLKPSNLKVAELREELKKRGLDQSGLKSDLVARLEAALAAAGSTPAATTVNDDDLEAEALLNEADQLTKSTVKPTVAANSTATVSAPVVVAVASASSVASTDALAARAKRFGLPVADKKPTDASTAAASSSSTTTTAAVKQAPVELDLEKLKARAERFGAVVSSSLTAQDEAERLRQRAERFGGPAPVDDAAEAERLQKRAERFGAAAAAGDAAAASGSAPVANKKRGPITIDDRLNASLDDKVFKKARKANTGNNNNNNNKSRTNAQANNGQQPKKGHGKKRFNNKKQ